MELHAPTHRLLIPYIYSVRFTKVCVNSLYIFHAVYKTRDPLLSNSLETITFKKQKISFSFIKDLFVLDQLTDEFLDT